MSRCKSDILAIFLNSEFKVLLYRTFCGKGVEGIGRAQSLIWFDLEVRMSANSSVA